METISLVISSTTGGSMPKPRPPARASPDSFSTMRSYRSGVLLSDLEAGEAADEDVLAESLDGLVDDIRHLPVGVLDVSLIEEANLLIPLLELPGGDLLDDLRRLARFLRLLTVNPHLPFDHLGIEALSVDRQRSRRRDLHRQRAGELPESVRLGDEIGLAVHLDQHADLAAQVDVRLHLSLAGLAAGLLGRLGLPAGPQQIDGRLEVAGGFLQGLLAFHHPHAGPLAQLLNL